MHGRMGMLHSRDASRRRSRRAPPPPPPLALGHGGEEVQRRLRDGRAARRRRDGHDPRDRLVDVGVDGAAARHHLLLPAVHAVLARPAAQHGAEAVHRVVQESARRPAGGRLPGVHHRDRPRLREGDRLRPLRATASTTCPTSPTRRRGHRGHGEGAERRRARGRARAGTAALLQHGERRPRPPETRRLPGGPRNPPPRVLGACADSDAAPAAADAADAAAGADPRPEGAVRFTLDRWEAGGRGGPVIASRGRLLGLCGVAALRRCSAPRPRWRTTMRKGAPAPQAKKVTKQQAFYMKRAMDETRPNIGWRRRRRRRARASCALFAFLAVRVVYYDAAASPDVFAGDARLEEFFGRDASWRHKMLELYELVQPAGNLAFRGCTCCSRWARCTSRQGSAVEGHPEGHGRDVPRRAAPDARALPAQLPVADVEGQAAPTPARSTRGGRLEWRRRWRSSSRTSPR